MPDVAFDDLPALAQHLRTELQAKKSVLIYAYNGTGKTRLSDAFRALGRELNEFGDTTKRDTLYFNAYTEDLFTWDNDLEAERQRVLELNDESRFFNGLRELEMEVKIGKQLQRYTDLNFYIDYDRQERSDGVMRSLPPAVTFFRERTTDGDPIPIKVSRGEENIFIWCFFLAIVQLVLDGSGAYSWVKYIYIDDPVSSLDENNAVMVAHHLAQIVKDAPDPLRVVISTHHVLFFNVLCNEMKKSRKYFLARQTSVEGQVFAVSETDSTPFLQHLAALVELHEAQKTGALYTHHFNTLRRVMEQTAGFFGYARWDECIRPEPGDPNQTIYKRVIDLMSHGDYSLYEPREMMPENKDHLRSVLKQFVTQHPFSPALFPEDAT
ncbi:MAG: AAA family ATPase [Terricaulis sp.]